jgi:hypothetical protein
MHDDYKQLDLSQIASVPPNGGPTLEPCPVCGSEAQLWQYSESDTAPRKLLGMCSHGEPIGPQDGLTNEGCLLYMPPNQFYRETIRDAVRYWNEFAKALTAMRAAGAAVPAPTPTECSKQSECANPTACEQEGVCVRASGVNPCCGFPVGGPCPDCPGAAGVGVGGGASNKPVTEKP